MSALKGIVFTDPSLMLAEKTPGCAEPKPCSTIVFRHYFPVHTGTTSPKDAPENLLGSTEVICTEVTNRTPILGAKRPGSSHHIGHHQSSDSSVPS